MYSVAGRIAKCSRDYALPGYPRTILISPPARQKLIHSMISRKRQLDYGIFGINTIREASYAPGFVS